MQTLFPSVGATKLHIEQLHSLNNLIILIQIWIADEIFHSHFLLLFFISYSRKKAFEISKMLP